MYKKKPFTIKDLTKEQLSLLPSVEDIEIYKDKGWYISPKIIHDEVLDNACLAVDEFYDGKLDFDLGLGVSDKGDEASSVIRNNEFTTLQKRGLQTLGFDKLLLGTASMLADTYSLRLFSDSLISKKPVKGDQKGIVGWHSDKAYWPTCTSDHMLTAWIPLQNVTMEMGPLMHIDGSHKWKEDSQLNSFYSFNNQNLGAFNVFLKDAKPDHHRSYMTLKRGQVSFHNCHTIHSSHPNTSTVNRVALAIHFQDHRNTYQKVFKEDESLIEIGYDRLCRSSASGNPDYEDPNFFPLVYDNSAV